MPNKNFSVICEPKPHRHCLSTVNLSEFSNIFETKRKAYKNLVEKYGSESLSITTKFTDDNLS